MKCENKRREQNREDGEESPRVTSRDIERSKMIKQLEEESMVKQVRTHFLHRPCLHDEGYHESSFSVRFTEPVSMLEALKILRKRGLKRIDHDLRNSVSWDKNVEGYSHTRNGIYLLNLSPVKERFIDIEKYASGGRYPYA